MMDMWRRHIASPGDCFDQRELTVRVFACSEKGHQGTVVPDGTIQGLSSVAKCDGFFWFHVCCARRCVGRADFEVNDLRCHISCPPLLIIPAALLYRATPVWTQCRYSPIP